MTKLEAIKARCKIPIGSSGLSWFDARERMIWLIERVDELAKVAREVKIRDTSLKLDTMARDALKSLDEENP